MKRIKFLFTLVAILLAGVLSAQNITVKGVVTDRETGEPIPFASIQVKGTTTGAAADTEGCFSLTVSTNATLVFSSIGYIPREVPVDGRGVIDVILSPDSEALDDVIVIAYGTAKKESVTGAVATVKSSEISKRPVSSVTDILEGQVSGIMVNSTYGEPGSGASYVHSRFWFC